MVNPIPGVLGHFEHELRTVLSAAGATSVVVRAGAPIEGLSAVRKVGVTLGTVVGRLALRAEASGTLVLWPAFGYLDALTWIARARRTPVLLLVHDVQPLRPQLGYSRTARRLFAWAVHRSRVQPVCLTTAAADELRSLTGVTPIVVPHPVARPAPTPTELPDRTRRPVRVLGQHKTAREVSSLHAIATGLGGACALEIKGRGWGEVSGWDVDSRFLSDEEFDSAIATSGCLVLPYARFYQSGVAVRALEHGVPVVARRHPHLEELFGASWPGFVEDEDWPAAVRRALSLSRTSILQRREHVIDVVVRSWSAVLEKTLR
ncbi:hypothetical protein [Antribacter gilvus]|uniref:hypothetical protein n=1 Tax=Antribacter gilvus TaxID=2304675 RepID=UPI000F7A3C5F|nr:hypothetical protein [Antribacter gilvus]